MQAYSGLIAEKMEESETAEKSGVARRRLTKNLCAFLLLAVIALPAAALAQQVNTDFDKGADFTQYKTYAYQVCHRVDDQLVDKRIVRELENRLAMEGLSKAEADPDVNVTYHSSTSEEFAVDTNTWGYGFGSGWYWGHGRGGYGGGGPISTTTSIRKYTRGTLVVDIWDARTKQLLWRGTAMFKKYPPEKKGK
jgi:hypothetical protein